MVIVGLIAEPPPVDIFDAALREVELATTVAHICDTNLPESLAVLAADRGRRPSPRPGDPPGAHRRGRLAPLAEGRAAGKIVVEVALVTRPSHVGFAGSGRMGAADGAQRAAPPASR